MTNAENLRAADVFVHGRLAGQLVELPDLHFAFEYLDGYDGPPVSLTMPVDEGHFSFDRFPAFFDGLLPEGWQLEAMLRSAKLDRKDRMGQLLVVGADTVGAVTIHVAGSAS